MKGSSYFNHNETPVMNGFESKNSIDDLDYDFFGALSSKKPTEAKTEENTCQKKLKKFF